MNTLKPKMDDRDLAELRQLHDKLSDDRADDWTHVQTIDRVCRIADVPLHAELSRHLGENIRPNDTLRYLRDKVTLLVRSKLGMPVFDTKGLPEGESPFAY